MIDEKTGEVKGLIWLPTADDPRSLLNPETKACASKIRKRLSAALSGARSRLVAEHDFYYSADDIMAMWKPSIHPTRTVSGSLTDQKQGGAVLARRRALLTRAVGGGTAAGRLWRVFSGHDGLPLTTSRLSLMMADNYSAIGRDALVKALTQKAGGSVRR